MDTKINEYAQIYQNEQGNLVLSDAIGDELVIAEGAYNKSLLKKGWNKSVIKTHNTQVDPFLAQYLAGYIEARLTLKDVNNFWQNLEANNSDDQFSRDAFGEVKVFFTNVIKGLNQRVANFDSVSEDQKNYLFRALYFYSQLLGFHRGYNEGREKEGAAGLAPISLEEFLIIQADGEISELMRFTHYSNSKVKPRLGDKNYFRKAFNINATNSKDIWMRLMWKSRCSALVKILFDENGNVADLLTGHTTWSEFSELLKIYKYYEFYLIDNYNDYFNAGFAEKVLSKRIQRTGKLSLTIKKSKSDKANKYSSTFSSYPGPISSTDDFYVTNNRLVVTETTLDVIDISLFNSVKPASEYIPNFMRVNSVSLFSKSAEEWINNFNTFNSGTYSSQWMVVDYNRFSKGMSRADFRKIFYVLEQTPDKMVSHDVSNELLENSYYGSFNRAFFTETEKSLHTALIQELYGDVFTFRGADRGKIFKQLEKKINNLDDFKDALRYNGYHNPNSGIENDPSYDHAGHGISARYDLDTHHHLAGGIDTKVVNSDLVNAQTSIAQAGPTTNKNPFLTPFTWSSNTTLRHVGVPDNFNFPWLKMNPTTLENDEIDDLY